MMGVGGGWRIGIGGGGRWVEGCTGWGFLSDGMVVIRLLRGWKVDML